MTMTSFCRGALLTGTALVALAAFAGSSHAQSVDYGALEQLFGEPVTTSATGKPQKASDAPANLTIITQDDIRRSGANNIPDILQFVTGIDVRRYGALDADAAVRGYNQPYNPRMLVMVNGRQVYLDDYGYVAWEVIPVQLDEIRQIEVVKGPNSALFGFNAASGVINIITYDPLFDNVNAATARFGSQSLMQGSGVATMHLGDKAGLRMSVGGVKQNEYAPNGLARAQALLHENPSMGAFNLDGKAKIAPGVEVTLEGSMATAQLDDQGPSEFMAQGTYHTNSIKAGVMADTAWGTMALTVYRNGLEKSVRSAVGGPALPISNAVYVVQASDTLQINADNVVRASLEYRNNSATSQTFFGGTIGYAVYSGAVMWDWHITPKLSFTNSVRVDYLTLNYDGRLLAGTGQTTAQYNDSTITQPSFNSGLVYKVTDLDTVRLLAGRGLQVPSLVDFGLQFRSSPFTPPDVGSPTLQPTAVWNLELDYDRSVPAIYSTIRSAVFVQRNDRLMSSSFTVYPVRMSTGLLAMQAENIGYSDAVGGEIGIKGQSPSGFRWNASYAVMSIHDHTSANKIATTSPQNYQEGTPTSVVILGGGYTYDKLELDAQARWQSSFKDYRFTGVGIAPIHISDYITFRGRVGYNLTKNVTLALTGQQLNFSRLLVSAGPPVERSVIGSVTVRY